MTLLQVKDLAIDFETKSKTTRVVDDVSFDLEKGEILGIVGESGSGKTITCRALLRLLPSNSARISNGTIHYRDQDLATLPDDKMRLMRGSEISMIFQNPSSHLNPVMTIGKQISEPLMVHEGLSRAEAKSRAIDLMRQVGISSPEHHFNSFPHQFSGGMRQRAMIATALSCRPSLLIADEPTTALDVTVQVQILRLLLDLRDKHGLAIILVTHDLGVVSQVADSVAVMYAGRIAEKAPKAELLQRPMHPYSQGLIRSQPELAAPDQALPSIKGQPPSLDSPPSGCRFRPRCEFSTTECETGKFQLSQVAPGRYTACPRWGELSDSAGTQ